MSRIRTLLLSLLGLAVVSAAPAEAQQDWEVALTGEVGYLFSVRTMAQNTGDVEQLQNVQVIADLSDALTAGVGVEIGRPGSNLRFRGRFHTTVGAEVEMQAAICEVYPGSTNPICTQFGSDVDVRSYLVDVRVVRGAPGDTFRPILGVGGGLRTWSFGPAPLCTSVDDETWRDIVCPRGLAIFENSSASPALIFGVGFMVDAGPLELSFNGEPHVSAYSGGVGNASGNTMIDLTVSLSGRLRLF